VLRYMGSPAGVKSTGDLGPDGDRDPDLVGLLALCLGDTGGGVPLIGDFIGDCRVGDTLLGDILVGDIFVGEFLVGETRVGDIFVSDLFGEVRVGEMG
jgi:hypothetical protein